MVAGPLTTARAEVLARIRAALGTAGGGRAEVPRAYRATADVELVDLLAERLRDYGAGVRHATRTGLVPVVSEALAERGARRIVVPPDLGLPGLAGITPDDGLDALDAADGVITRAALAIAETGTIILDGGPGQGRRALSLVPDYHLCLVETTQIVAIVPEALARLRPGRPQTWISGPSATSDIELDRVQGVHGPRTLEVILVRP
jgi:L-lactate dehydrogenase complex protein LldG